MKFKYVLSLLNDRTVHPHPPEHQVEIDFVKEILTNGKGYLTRRTKEKPYCRVVFFDEKDEIFCRVRDGVYDLNIDEE